MNRHRRGLPAAGKLGIEEPNNLNLPNETSYLLRWFTRANFCFGLSPSASGSTAMVYLFSGAKVIAEYLKSANASSPAREYIYLGGALLASRSPTMLRRVSAINSAEI